jgi:amino acid adenylation domain-containing protein/non-ribosomal peptide synthase protein (TIGR01720 family)
MTDVMVEGFRLSSQQRRLWVQQSGESPADCAQGAILIQGDLDPAALERALRRLVERHEILRTAFRRRHGMKFPLQIVEDGMEVAWSVQPAMADLASKTIEQVLRQQRSQPFDLERGPLVRASLVPCTGGHLLTLSLPSLCADEWSLRNAVTELAATYRSPAESEEESLQYSAFSQWQEELVEGEDDDEEAAAGKAFWAKLGLIPLDGPKLPGEASADRASGFDFDAVTVAIPPALATDLEALAARCGASRAEVLLAAWSALLWRLTRPLAMTVGVVFSGRRFEELHGALGLFAQTLPVVLHPAEGIRFQEFLAQVREAERQVDEQQDYAGLDGGRDDRPDFQFAFQATEHPAAINGAAITLALLRSRVCSDRFRVRLSCTLRPGELAADLEYDVRAFDRATVQGLAEQLLQVLGQVARTPALELGDLDLLAEEERRRLDAVNATAADLGEPVGVHELFAAQARRFPERVAMICGEREMRYGELDAAANRLAWDLTEHLADLAVGPEARVGLLLDRSVEMVTALLAVLKAGGAYVPLDPELPPGRLTQILDDAGASVVVTRSDLAPRLPAGTAARVIALDTDADRIGGRPAAAPPWRRAVESLAYVLFTSGSTGRPKGVMVEHRQLFNYVRGVMGRLGLREGASYAMVSTFAADLGNTMLFPALCGGGSLQVMRAEVASDPESLAAALRRHPADYLKIVPSHLGAMLEGADPQAVLPRDLLVLGGEALRWELVAKVAAVGSCRIANHYGPTETTVGVVAGEVTPEERRGQATVPLGQPLPNSRVYLLDSRGHRVPAGVAGELYVGGAGVARGYLGQPGLTAERFVPDGHQAHHGGEPGARLYRTGDLVRLLPEGLEFLGRVDHQVKVRGFRIELGEIETVLLRHPAVREAVAIVREDVPGNPRLVAYVSLRQGPAMTAGALRSHVQESLPDSMVPAAVVILPGLPLTANGKIDRQSLPEPERTTSKERSYLAPRNDAERQLAEIWEQVLGQERIGIEDNFFTLGGDSILAIQVIARANRAGLALSPRQLFRHQTVAELAAVVGTGPQIRSEQGLITGRVPLTPIQHWFFAQEQPEPWHWNQSLLMDVRGSVEPRALGPAIDRLLEHHDALRMRYVRHGEEWHQEAGAAAGETPFSLLDLSMLPEPLRRGALEAAAAQAQESLDLASGPLLRIALVDLGTTRRLLLVAHHLVVDGVSWSVLLDDLLATHDQILRGEPVRLPEKTSSFKAWAERLVESVAAGTLDGEAAHWPTAIPSDAPALPLDRSGGANTIGSVATALRLLSPEVTRTLLQDVPPVYGTRVDDLLLTALVRAFGGWRGDPRLLLEMEGHGREPLFDDVDLSRTIGWFTARFPVFLDLTGVAEPGASIRAVKEQLRRVPGRGIGYGLLRYLSEDRELRQRLESQAAPQVSFNYLGQLDQVLSDSAPLWPAPEASGSELSPRGRRNQILEVGASVGGGRLLLRIAFSRNLHDEATIEALLDRFSAELQSLIDHCLTPGAGGYTPSDFPLAALSGEALDRIAPQLSANGPGQRTARGVEDLYPLSPLQENLLFHALSFPASGVGFEQSTCVLRGPLDVAAFEQTWQRVVDRHPILRTAFLVDGLDRPLQVVRPRVPFQVERQDWSSAPPSEQQARLAEHLEADRARGFDVGQMPLMRVALIRLGEDAHQFVWSYHHLLLDGWCRGILLNEVFALYDAFARGGDAELRISPPYREYIAWIARQDPAQAERFWREMLAGVAGPSPLRVDRLGESRLEPPGEYPFRDVVLSRESAAALQELAQGRQLTLNTLVQGAWALLLSRYSGQPDAISGVTVSGRPAELPEVESMLGMFINNLPLRVRVPREAALLPWLRELQELLLELRQYEYTSPAQIQPWSGLSAGQRLFDTLVLFQNYPVGDAGDELESHSLSIEGYRFRLQTNFPLTLVAASADSVVLRIYHDSRLFDTATVERMLGHLRTLLESMPAAGDRRLSDLPLLTEAERRELLAAGASSALGARAEVLDEQGQPLPFGVPGELWMAETAEASPVRTGQAARVLARGGVEVLGELAAPVLLHGYPVDLAEIEALLRRHPAVRAAAVTVESDASGAPRLVAHVAADAVSVPSAPSVPSAGELRDRLRRTLPEPMIPSIYRVTADLPTTAEGRIDRQALTGEGIHRLGRAEAFTAPRNPTELALVHVWEELLGVRPIGIHDDFFVLGGYSVLAVRLMAHIRSRFGRELPLSSLLGASTVAGLARLLDKTREPREWSPLVEIRASGHRTPLFLAHPGGGNVLSYVDLAYRLGGDQPVYGLQARGLTEGQEPVRTVEEMADLYLQAVRTVQPRGPYLLGGWSFGSAVALEMAQRLLSCGESVGLLAILDGWLREEEMEIDESRLLLSFFGEEFPGLAEELIAQGSIDEQIAHAIRRAVAAGLLPADFDLSRGRRLFEVRKSNLQAARDYRPRPYSGKITLFRAAERGEESATDPLLGWGRLTPDVDVHVVSGRHETIVLQPNVEVLAERLRRVLQGLDVRSGGAGSLHDL